MDGLAAVALRILVFLVLLVLVNAFLLCGLTRNMKRKPRQRGFEVKLNTGEPPVPRKTENHGPDCP
jgi:hypothetical protein